MTTIVPSKASNNHRPITASTSSNVHSRAGGVPAAMPADEVIYWTQKWRAGEAETEAAFAAGEGITFDSENPTDVARWLLSDD